MFEIEKDVPVPNGRSGPKLAKFPLAKMEIGESFLIPYKTSAIRGVAKQVPQAGINIKAANTEHAPKRFKKSRTDKGIRVHRIE